MRLKRHALLIAAPKLKDHRDHPGTQVDVAELRRWMLSNPGGAWEDGEIEILNNNPSWEDLTPWLEYQAKCDYVFNAFAGHGYMVNADYGGNDTAICLRDGQDIRVKALNPGNKRCTILADCCRNLSIVIPAELIEEQKAYAKIAEADDRGRFRELFDQAVLSAEEGATYLYSCGENQSAADDDNQGGLFTFQLLNSAREWASYQPKNAVLYIDRAFEAAQTRTIRVEPQQHPHMPPVRRRRHFPFAVT
jgi:hypothetical protein